MIKQFEDVRQWGAIRGIGSASFQRQYQRVLQEVVEIHDAFNNDDMDEVSDAIDVVVAIGDFFLIVVAFTLTNKVYSPQYSLWLVPLAVMARPRWRGRGST